MKRLIALLSGGVLATGLGVGVLAHEGHDHNKRDAGKPTTVQGELIDAACYVDSGGSSKGKGHAKCATKCMASGIPAAVLPEGSKEPGEILYLLTNPTVLAQYAGRTVRVEGTVHSEMHAIDVKSVSVQNGGQWQQLKLQDEHHDSSDGNDAGGHHGGEAGDDKADHEHGSGAQAPGRAAKTTVAK